MKRSEVVKNLENLLINSGIDTDSKLWKNAVTALIAVWINDIQEDKDD